MDEIKEWRADNYGSKVCGYLMLQKVSFSYTEESGLVFTAPRSFVDKMTYSLKVSYGCSKIRFTEI